MLGKGSHRGGHSCERKICSESWVGLLASASSEPVRQQKQDFTCTYPAEVVSHCGRITDVHDSRRHYDSVAFALASSEHSVTEPRCSEASSKSYRRELFSSFYNTSTECYCYHFFGALTSALVNLAELPPLTFAPASRSSFFALSLAVIPVRSVTGVAFAI